MFKQALGAAYRSVRLVRGQVRGLARAIRKRRPFRPGLPPGLTFAEVDAVCWAKTGRGLRSAVFAHLSGWKESGAYRLVLRLDDRREWPAVYKLSVYGGDQIPALLGFPAQVGPPEYAVYRFGSGPVSDYLPEVYFAEEREPGRCYRYLMEDLAESYQVLPGRRGLEAIVGRLPELHRALCEWGEEADLSRFIRYDASFSAGLRQYTEAALAAFAGKFPDSEAAAWLQTWPRVAEKHADPGFDPYEQAQPIHGDLNLRNVVFGRRNQGSVRLLDWEWAGWGRPLADLAAVVKHLPAGQVDWALDAYAAAARFPDLQAYRRRFHWELLERGLIDAAFMARQIVESPPKTTMNVLGFLNDSLRQVTASYRALEGVTGS